MRFDTSEQDDNINPKLQGEIYYVFNKSLSASTAPFANTEIFVYRILTQMA